MGKSRPLSISISANKIREFGNLVVPGAIIGDVDLKRAPFLVLGLSLWYGKIIFLFVINLEIIGWKKFWGQPKLDKAVGRVQFGSPRNFLNPIISKLDKHLVLLPINYIGSKNRWTRQIFYPLKYSISHFALLSTSQVKHFNTGFLLLWVFLFWLFSLISSKSVASISRNLAEDSIWKCRRQRGGEKSREFRH